MNKQLFQLINGTHFHIPDGACVWVKIKEKRMSHVAVCENLTNGERIEISLDSFVMVL